MPQIPPRTRTAFRILALAAWAVSLAGQIDTGLIVGSVADPSGAAVPEAGIVLRSGSTGVRFRSQTNDAGRFQSPPLRPDSYEVYVRKAGFKTGTATVTLAVQQRAELNFVLEVGDVAQEVTVDAAAARLETESSAMANLRGSKAVSDLPLNSRNFAFLVGLAPGTVASFTQTTTPLNATIKRGVTNLRVPSSSPSVSRQSALVGSAIHMVA